MILPLWTSLDAEALLKQENFAELKELGLTKPLGFSYRTEKKNLILLCNGVSNNLTLEEETKIASLIKR